MTDLSERGRKLAQGKYRNVVRPSSADRFGTRGAEGVADSPDWDDDPWGDIPPADEEPPPDDDWEYTDPTNDDGAADDGDVENRIRFRLGQMRINREAKRRLDAEDRPALTPPPVQPFAEWIAQPVSPTRYRIDKVAPANARVLLAAQYKSGKTDLIGNLIRALADQDRFLGAFTVNTAAQHIVVIDDELDEDMLRSWHVAQNIRSPRAIAEVIPLRGRVASFNILDDRTRDLWVRRLRDHGCDYLALDCLRPILDACGLDEGHDAGQFLLAYDELLLQAKIDDSIIVHHMGHGGERSRGDSRLLDWPDVSWNIVREDDDPASTRYFKAYGRGVNVREGRLHYDPETHHLTYMGGSRRDGKTEAAYVDLIRLLANSEPLGVRAVQNALGSEHPRDAIRAAIKLGVDKSVLAVDRGKDNAKLHRIAYPCEVCGLPVATQKLKHLSCPSEPELPYE